MDYKKLPGSKIEFEVTVSAEDFEKSLNEAATELAKENKISGFRPGKAPRNIVEKEVGAEKVLARGADKAVKKSYIDTVVAEKLDVIGSPEITIVKIAPGNDLVYKVTSALMPEIKIGNYREEIKKINSESQEKSKNLDVQDEDVEKEIEKLRKSRSQSKPVERAAQENDRAEIDFEILINNVPIEGGTGKKYPLILGSKTFIPGFEDNILGMKKGDKKEFEITFPGKYHAKDLAGKKALVKAEVQSVEEMSLPEVNDEFAKSLGKFENIAALKKSIHEGIQKEKEHAAKQEQQKKIIDVLIEKTEVELPETLIEEEIHKMMHELEHNISSTGMKLDDYLKQIGKTHEDLHKDWKKDAEKRVISALALQKLIKDNDIEAAKEEVEEEANKTLAYYKTVPHTEEQIDIEQLYRYTKNAIENDKVIKFLESL